MRKHKPYYETLGVPRDAPHADVKRAYRALVREFHPDRLRNAELRGKAEERLKEITAAWSEYVTQRAAEKEPPPRKSQRHPRPEEEGEPREKRRKERSSRERHRVERLRWLSERDERERRARERAKALRGDRDSAQALRAARQHARHLTLFRLALAGAMAFAGVLVCLFVVLLLRSLLA